MKKHAILVLASLALLALFAAGCGGAATAPTATPVAAAQAPAVSAALSISGAVEKPMSWSLADLKSMEIVKLTLTHPKKGAGSYEGVRLVTVINAAKPAAAAKTLVMSAKDGFTSEMAMADVLKCADCLLTIDSAGALGTAIPNATEGAMWVRDLIKLEVK